MVCGVGLRMQPVLLQPWRARILFTCFELNLPDLSPSIARFHSKLRYLKLKGFESANMDGAVDKIYQPKPGFVEEKKEPLIDLESTDSTELWLIQWPINQSPEFNGQQFSLKLEGNGHVGTFECPSGKSYEMISLKSQGQEETVFVSSASEAKVAGKISRHVSLVHYPEPNELQKRNILNLSQSQRSSMATSTMSGRRLATPTRSMRPRNSQGMSGYSTPSSRTKSTTVTELGESSKLPKRKRANDSAQDSGKTTSAVTSTGSVEQSQETRSKKKRKTEN